MRAAVGERQGKSPMLIVLCNSARPSEVNPNVVGLRHVRHENALPVEPLATGVLDIEDIIREALIEDSRFDLQRNLLCQELITELAQICRSLWSDPHG